MKAYTNLEQSKKLAEILPFESADMWYWEFPTAPTYNDYGYPMFHKGEDIRNVPCWSLTALLGIIPKHIKNYNVLRIDISDNDFGIWYDDVSNGCVNETLPDITMESAVDACVEMIIKLKEQNLI